MTTAKKGITRKTATTSTKYTQGRNLTFYFNSVKRSGKDKREDAFLMVDSEELITLADTLRDDHELPPKEVAAILLQLILEEGNINMTYGDEVKKDESTSTFDISAVLAALKK